MKAAKKIIINVPDIGRVESLPGGEFDPGGKSFEAMTTEMGRVHHTENDSPSLLSFSVVNLSGQLEAWRGLSGVNVNVQDDIGQSWIVEDAFVTTTPKSSGGSIRIEMAGNPAERA